MIRSNSSTRSSAVGAAAVVGALALAVSTACRGPTPPEPRFPGANVLLVTIDTLRADRLGAYGYRQAGTPRLDALAAEGIRFDQLVSPVPLTLPAHTSLMTAMLPYEHGVRDNGASAVPADIPMLAESFGAAGYDTAAFVASYVLHSRWGLGRGFDVYDDADVQGTEGLEEGLERRGDRVLDAALAWLRRPRASPFFAWVHFYDPHSPYEAPDPYGARFADNPYDGEVAYTDSIVGELLDSLASQGLAADTIVVVTADHGEDLWDHGTPGHGLMLYDTTVRIPLIVRLPDGSTAGKVVAEQGRLIDVGPTVLDLIGLPPLESASGESLVPLVFGGAPGLAAYSETMYPRWHFGWQELRALREDGYKYVLAPRPELYDLGRDPGETTNIAADRPELAAAMRAELEMHGEAAEASGADPGEPAADAARRLRALGYIGAAPSDLADGPLPDPKDKLEIYVSLIRVNALIGRGADAEAEALLLDIIATDPRIVDAHHQLGGLRLKRQDYDGAVDSLLSALALRPDHYPVLVLLGVAHRRAGDVEAARADFEALLGLDPDDDTAHRNLGEMALEAGDAGSALSHFDRVSELYTEPAAVHFGAGVAAFELGRWDRSRAELDRVATLDPDYPYVHYHRARVEEAMGDTAAAAARYRTAVEHDGNDYRSWFDLALLLIDTLGDHSGGVDALRGALRANPDLGRARIYLGRELVFLADPDTYAEAEALLRGGLELDPPATIVPMAHHALAELYRRVGRSAEAAQELALARAAERAIRR